MTWDELVWTLSQHQTYAAKHEGWLWSPVRYRPGTRRGKANVESVSLFVADVDDGVSGEDMYARLLLLGSSFLVVSTWSHTPEEPHLRCILPLAEPIPAHTFIDVWQRFNIHLFNEHIDAATKDPSRMFYGPSCPQEHLGDVYVRQF